MDTIYLFSFCILCSTYLCILWPVASYYLTIKRDKFKSVTFKQHVTIILHPFEYVGWTINIKMSLYEVYI